MMTQQLRFSVLTAPIAAIDRRALSQAWYSALFRAHDGAGANAAAPARDRGSARAHTTPPSELAARRSAVGSDARIRAPRIASQARVGPAPLDRRMPRSPLARRIERVFAHATKSCERASFTLEGDAARVHITLQSIGGTLRLVAVCPPAVRSRVARALEEARYALAERGIGCTLDVREA